MCVNIRYLFLSFWLCLIGSRYIHFIRTDSHPFLFMAEEYCIVGFPGSSAGKESAGSSGDLVWSLGLEDPLEGVMGTHTSILAWRIPTDRGAWWATVHGVVKNRNNWATQCRPAQHRIPLCVWTTASLSTHLRWTSRLLPCPYYCK